MGQERVLARDSLSRSTRVVRPPVKRTVAGSTPAGTVGRKGAEKGDSTRLEGGRGESFLQVRVLSLPLSPYQADDDTPRSVRPIGIFAFLSPTFASNCNSRIQ
jgi:hypothetical protein